MLYDIRFYFKTPKEYYEALDAYKLLAKDRKATAAADALLAEEEAEAASAQAKGKGKGKKKKGV